MAIKIDKAISKSYLISQLEGFERYALYDTKTREKIVVPENYTAALSTDPGALQIIASGVTPTASQVNLDTVEAVVGTGIFNIGDYVIHVAEQKTTESYLRHRYRKLDESYVWAANFEYAIGTVCIYDEKLWRAVKVSNKATFDQSDWTMVGAASIFNVVSALPAESTLDEDQAFLLKADEMDESVTPAVVKHKKGLWIFDATTKAYTQYHEYEIKDLDFAEIWDSTKTSTYTGDADKVVTSKYFYDNIKVFGDKVWDEIKDLYDIVGTPNYIILDDAKALKDYDLTTLPSNSANIFMVKKDDTISQYEEIANPGTYITVAQYEALTDAQKALYQPVYPYLIPGSTDEYYSTLYICLCDDDTPVTDRHVDYIGRLNFGEHGIDAIVDEKINKALHETIAAHYEKDEIGAADALTVVADGTKANMIELASVTPIVSGETIVVGSSVAQKPAYQTGTTINVVADGTTPLASNELEVSTVNASLVDGQAAFSAGDTVDEVQAYYVAVGGKQVIADGTLNTYIELSAVTPVKAGYTPAVGDKVVWKEESLATEYKFILRSEVDDETLQKLTHEEVTYTDPDDPTSTQTVDYLKYDTQKIMPLTWESANINFDDSSEYTPTTDGEIIPIPSV